MILFDLPTERTNGTGHILFTGATGMYQAFNDVTNIRVTDQASPVVRRRGFATYILSGSYTIDGEPNLGPLWYLNEGNPVTHADPGVQSRPLSAAKWYFKVGNITTTGGVGSVTLGVYYSIPGESQLDPIVAAADPTDYNLGTKIQSQTVASNTLYEIQLPAAAVDLATSARYVTLALRNETSLSLGQSVTVPIDQTRSTFTIYLADESAYTLGG